MVHDMTDFACSVIALFNHKGGVSKTTTAFNLGWALAEQGNRVMIVDADPQCNLTGMALELAGRDDLISFYNDNPNSNIYQALRPAFGGHPRPLAPAYPVATNHRRMSLLAGHIDFATYEPELAMAHKVHGAMPILRNLIGAFGHSVRITAKNINANIVLIDMSPSIGAINQNIWLQSDYFIVPTSPDYFCLMAINSLSKILPEWNGLGDIIRAQQGEIEYRIPNYCPKFIGMLSQRYRPRSGKPAKAFQEWIDRIVQSVTDSLIPRMTAIGGSITREEFLNALPDHNPFELAQIPDFNSLIAQSQEHATPIFALTPDQLERTGIVLENLQASQQVFFQIFNSMAAAISRLCPPR